MPKLNHIAVLVEDVDSASQLFSKIWGLEPTHVITVDSQGVRTATYEFDNIMVELMEPYGDESPVARSLAKRGPGIHHMAVEVDDVASRMKALKDMGLRFTSEEPSTGVGGARICFLHPKGTYGILTELVQPAEE